MARGTEVRVRMYRQGLGDCLLLSLLRPGGAPFHMMFDCGVILGTANAGAIMDAVVADIIAETGGRVDVLVVTHEHYDHVSGFKLAADRFAAFGSAKEGRLSVGDVWYAWTEDPDDAAAKQIRAERQARLSALAQSSSQLALGDEKTAVLAPMLTQALGFFGVGADGKGVGDTAAAMAFPATLVGKGHVRYLRPGEVVRLPGAPEFRIFVLGPPTDPASLRKTDSVPEVYHVDGEGALPGGALPGSVQADGSWRPFEATWSAELAWMQGTEAAGPFADFLRARYFGQETPTPSSDVGWRRIDGAWLEGTEQLALALDSATNNTSVALAIELVETGEVLLFPADAQVGNWLSWHKLGWTVEGKAVDTPDLLARTIFYKVGHHGSGNATLKAKGLEMMTSEKLVAFIPVDHEMAVQKRWGNMPLPSLVEDLAKRSGGRVVRIDDAAPPAGFGSGGTGGKFGSLYYEWRAAIGGGGHG